MIKIVFDSGVSLKCNSIEEASKKIGFSKSQTEAFLQIKRFPSGKIFKLQDSIIQKKDKKKDVLSTVREMWGNMNGRAKRNSNYKDINVLMTQQEFFEWALPEVKLFLKTKKGSPSVDRINVNGDYSLDNIQIISRSENTKKIYEDKPEQREYMRLAGKERFSKRVKLTLKNGDEYIYDSSYDLERNLGLHRSYAYWRLLPNTHPKHRKLPNNWEKIEYIS